MKPNTLKDLLVHPKDKRDEEQTCDCVYEIPCNSCNQVYIGETGRAFGTRLKRAQKGSEETRGKEIHMRC